MLRIRVGHAKVMVPNIFAMMHEIGGVTNTGVAPRFWRAAVNIQMTGYQPCVLAHLLPNLASVSCDDVQNDFHSLLTFVYGLIAANSLSIWDVSL